MGEAQKSVEIGAPTVVKLARGVRLRDDPVRGQTVLLAPERTMVLDDIALHIVRALDGARSLDEIAETFAGQFGAPKADILADMIAFVREFSERRLLEFVP